MIRFLLLCMFFCSSLLAQSLTPVAYEGRFIPLDVYADRYIEDHSIQTTNPLLYLLEQEFSNDTNGDLFQMLPGKNGHWYPLKALSLKTGNFTLYSNSLFQSIQEKYLLLDIHHSTFFYQWNEFCSLLQEGYSQIQKKEYPSWSQLWLESMYHKYPWLGLLIGMYLFSFVLLISPQKNIGFICLCATWVLHTLFLAARSFILLRPPVSNMFETMIYVPWIAVAITLLFCKSKVRNFLLPTSAIFAVSLLAVLVLSGMDGRLHNTQPVLNSQYWLIVHVLMVVASYGAFVLGGLLSHLYLLSVLYSRRGIPALPKKILQLLYIGTGLLICGTLLGGVWAAQSWGRFWDWDPKESWAFISSAIYLVIIHLYQFKQIGEVGLAIGSILGMLAITFTWYGVNYILGTGFHSYGFGSGGELYYYLFLAVEICWIGLFLSRFRKQQNPNF